MVEAVSVVLPVHNAAATIARAVASVQAQTHSDWELLVIDDGSTDATRAILLELAASDPRVRVLDIARAGIVAALNTGLAAATSPLIARMDADDEAHPQRLELQARYLEAHPQVGLVGCQVEFGGDREKSAAYALQVDWLNSLVTPEQIALNRFVESPFAHPSVMFRRQLVHDYGEYAEGDFPEDYELWLRWLDADVRMAKVPQPLLRWNDPPGRLSRTDQRYSEEAFYRLKAHWLAEWLRRSELDRALELRCEHGASTPVTPRPVYLWGSGRPTRQRAALLEAQGITIAGYIDVEARKAGKAIEGRPVLPTAELPPAGTALVLGYVAVAGARDSIRGELLKAGYREGRDFLMCA